MYCLAHMMAVHLVCCLAQMVQLLGSDDAADQEECDDHGRCIDRIKASCPRGELH